MHRRPATISTNGVGYGRRRVRSAGPFLSAPTSKTTPKVRPSGGRTITPVESLSTSVQPAKAVASASDQAGLMLAKEATRVCTSEFPAEIPARGGCDAT